MSRCANGDGIAPSIALGAPPTASPPIAPSAAASIAAINAAPTSAAPPPAARAPRHGEGAADDAPCALTVGPDRALRAPRLLVLCWSRTPPAELAFAALRDLARVLHHARRQRRVFVALAQARRADPRVDRIRRLRRHALSRLAHAALERP